MIQRKAAPYVLLVGKWANVRRVKPQATRILYRIKILQELSMRLMQVTVGACILHRVREALGAAARVAAGRGVRVVQGRAVLRAPVGPAVERVAGPGGGADAGASGVSSLAPL